MDQHPSNVERGAETAIITAGAAILAVSLGNSLSRRRRAQGRSPRAAKVTCLVIWVALVVYWVVAVSDSAPAGSGTYWWAVAFLAAVSIPVSVIAAYLLLVLLSVFDRATGRVATNRPGHWVTVAECAQKRALCLSMLSQIHGTMAWDALLAVGTGAGELFGTDLASAAMIGDQLRAVNQIEAHLRAGRSYWIWDD